MEFSNINHAESMSAAGSARIQVGNNTTNNYYQDGDEKYLVALCSTDPRHDKIRIEQTNGGLLKDSYLWVLQNPEFQYWRDANENHPLLWIRGDPGKGKTMLLSGIIDELKPLTRLEDSTNHTSLSYFFCQATNSGLNSATVVLRGLVYLLLDQNRCLLSHVRDKPSLNPEHWNSAVSIRDVLSKILEDPSLQDTILVVDALDECLEDLDFLLEVIISTSCPQVRWLVSSRNIYDIEQHLRQTQTKVALSLELNAESVSQAVNHYIHHRVHQLGVKEQLRSEDLSFAETYLSQNAHGTFLWVALVCQRLERSKKWEVRKLLQHFPPGLTKLYERMMETIGRSFSHDLYKRILAIVSTVHRPLTFSELMAIEDLSIDEDMVPEMVMECGCFLTSRDKVIYFVHQSAKDFLSKQQDELFPSGLAQHHLDLFHKSLKSLEKLKMDIYDQVYPAISVENALLSRPEPDPLSGLAYSCRFWAHHLRDSHTICTQDQSDYNKAHHFIAGKFLFWLEALSLCRILPAAMETLQILEDLPLGDAAMALVEDARQFFLYFRHATEEYPLQIYASGLLFSPEESLIRHQFEHCSPKFVAKKPRVDAQWHPYLIIPETECKITFSSDNKTLVTTSFRGLAKWNVSNGMEILRTQGDNWALITLSPDLKWFACVTRRVQDRGWPHIAVQVRGPESNIVKWSKELGNHKVEMMEFSPDSQWLAVCFDEELVLWGVENKCTRWFKISRLPNPIGIKFSSDGALIAVFGFQSKTKNSIVVLDTRTRTQHKYPNADIGDVSSAVFSPKTHEILMCVKGKVWSWDIFGGECTQWPGFDGFARRIASSHDSSWIAVASDSSIFLYGKQNQELLQQFEVPASDDVFPIAVSFDDKRIAVSSEVATWLWDISSSTSKQTHRDRVAVKKVFVSDNGNLMAWALEKEIQVWDATTGSHLAEFDMHWCWRPSAWSTENLAAFSSQGHLLVASSSPPSSPSLLFVWDLNGKKPRRKIEVADSIRQLAVSHDRNNHGQWVAAITTDTICVWDATTMELQWSLKHSDFEGRHPESLQFSDGSLVVIWLREHDPLLIYYDVTSGKNLNSLELSSPGYRCEYVEEFSVSPSGQRAVRVSGENATIWISFISQEEGGIRRAFLEVDMWYKFSFLDDSTILTNRGMFDVDAILAEAANKPVEEIPPFDPDFFGFGCSDGGDWITLDGYPLLWLPLQYRLKSKDIRIASGERHFATHAFSGVFFMQFSGDTRDFLPQTRHNMDLCLSESESLDSGSE